MEKTRYTVTVHDHKTDEIKEYPANALILECTDGNTTSGCILCYCEPADAAIMGESALAQIKRWRKEAPMIDKMIDVICGIKAAKGGVSDGETVELGPEQ